MIQKFRWRFILMSIFSLFIVLFVSIGSLIGVSFYRDYGESNRVMTALVRNEGNLGPQASTIINGRQKNNLIAGRRNPEAVFQYRYFSVGQDKNGRIFVINRPRQFNLDQKQLTKKSKNILIKSQDKGIVTFDANRYLFQKTTSRKKQPEIIFLNISLIYQHSWIMMRLAVFLSILALLIFTLVLTLLSGKAIAPIADAYHKQRQFITNAGHELKTPLAIISANTEMQEMLGHENEWTKSTKEQTERLTDLINHLISLARMSEPGDLVLTKVDLSAIAEKVSQNFSSIMKSKKLSFESNIRPHIYVSAEEKSLRELVNIFLDNAQKYCDQRGKVSLNLHKNRLNTYGILTISNTYKNGKNVNYNNFFERFYREDKSHNNQKSGFGIGLSMAQDLVHAFKGRIKVSYRGDTISFIILLKLTH